MGAECASGSLGRAAPNAASDLVKRALLAEAMKGKTALKDHFNLTGSGLANNSL